MDSGPRHKPFDVGLFGVAYLGAIDHTFDSRGSISSKQGYPVISPAGGVREHPARQHIQRYDVIGGQDSLEIGKERGGLPHSIDRIAD